MILCLILSYLLGSIPTAYLVGKFVKGIDIRKHGSGNVGATNVFRTVGKRWGSFSLAADMLKGFMATFYLAPFFFIPDSGTALPIWQLISGALVIAGHAWPLWLRFKGGKGVATSCGVFLGIYPWAVLSALVVWIVSALLSRFVSLSSLIAAFSFQFFLYFFYRHTQSFSVALTLAIALFLFILFTHRTNIQRLMRGVESKIQWKKNT